MKNFVEWQDPWPVFIKPVFGASELLKPALLTTQIKERGVRTVGIMLDADDNLTGRYESIKNTCARFSFPMPATLPAGGAVSQNAGGMRFGVWIMPDNTSPGYLETFLRYLIPNKEESIWKHAEQSVKSARSFGAKCPAKDVPKSSLYTWLAWQETPGQQPGLALTKHILDPNSAYAEPFVNWFRALYEL